MFRVLYQALSFLCVPFVFTYLILRGIRDRSYRDRRAERFGYVPPSIPKNCIWFHAVSTGEAIATVQIVESLLDANSELPLLITTTTPTGSREITTRLGSQVSHCYAPYDTPGSVNRFLQRTRPQMLFLMETELWPHLVRKTFLCCAPVYLINARLSEKSLRGYEKVGDLTTSMLKCLTGIACQDTDSADRFERLGYSNPQTVVTGSVKWDIEMPPSLPPKLQNTMESLRSSAECLWIAGSTHPGEEEVALEAHNKIRDFIPNARLVLAPRHIRRCTELLEQCRKSGFKTELLDGADETTEVVLIDQMGILFRLYGFAKLAFIGGSLQGTGGHNPIEAAVQGVPIAMGPDRHNFAEICDQFMEQDCINEVSNADELASTVVRIHEKKDEWDRQSLQVRSVVSSNQGALARLRSSILHWIEIATAGPS